MDFKLELLPVPVMDVDRAKRFYMEQVGFQLDHDVRPTPAMRVVQLTPPGSGCSIVLSAGLPSLTMPAGCLRGLHLVVADIAQARAALLGRGVAMGEIADMGGVKYASFQDPDGNSWVLQQLLPPHLRQPPAAG